MEIIGIVIAVERNLKLIQATSSTPAPTITTDKWIGAKTAMVISKIWVLKSLSDKY